VDPRVSIQLASLALLQRQLLLAGDSIIEELEWEEGKSGGIEMKERREIRFFSFPDGAKGIDVTLTYRAGDTVPLRIKPMNWMNQNDQIFALMVIRIDPELGETRVVTAAPGKVVNTAQQGAEVDAKAEVYRTKSEGPILLERSGTLTAAG
jgi:hypothetical protein